MCVMFYYETLVAIPHNNPDKWVDMINNMFPGRSSGGVFKGHNGSNGSTIEIHDHNHYLNREVETVRRIENGRMISKYGT